MCNVPFMGFFFLKKSAPHMSSSARRLLEFKSRDVVIKTISRCGNFRISVANTSNTARDAIRRHSAVLRQQPDPQDCPANAMCSEKALEASRLVGDLINFSTLAASFLDREERVIAQYQTASHKCVAESMALGECRSFVSPPSDDSTPVVGGDHQPLRVDRVLYHHARPVTSVTSLKVSELTEQVSLEWDREHHNAANDDDDVAVRKLFRSSLMPHVNAFFRQSEGVPVAALLRCDMMRDTRQQGNNDVAFNTGLLVQPVVADQFVPMLGNLQRAFYRCWSDDYISSSEASMRWEGTMLRRSHEHRTSLMDLLALATGDFEGAYAVSEHCRLPTTSIESCAADIEPLRRFLGLMNEPSERIVLDSREDAVQRTAVDFFCRCSKADLLRALRSCSTDQLNAAKEEPVTCKYCKKDITPTSEEWDELIRRSLGNMDAAV